MSNTVTAPYKILRLNRLKEKTGISRSSIYNKLNSRSKYYDSTFPQPIRLGASSVGWNEADVDAWLINRQQGTQVCQNKN